MKCCPSSWFHFFGVIVSVSSTFVLNLQCIFYLQTAAGNIYLSTCRIYFNNVLQPANIVKFTNVNVMQRFSCYRTFHFQNQFSDKQKKNKFLSLTKLLSILMSPVFTTIYFHPSIIFRRE